MSETSTFDELIRRVRAGDQDAAAELVRAYDPEIRRVVRFRLADARLGGLLDSMDICQSVLKSFFARAASGQFELETPGQLLALLAKMARNKLVSQARRQHARRRDVRRADHRDGAEDRLVDPGASPSRQVDASDLLHEIRTRLSVDERRLMELRAQGRDWAAIASDVGGTADASRMKLTRAINRVASELGLDDDL